MFKCILCSSTSFSCICKKCQRLYLQPQLNKRIISNNFEIFSFYPYSEIENFIKTKHTYHGNKIYKLLAKNSFLKFAKEFKSSSLVYVLPIDDRVSSLYSHTAILAHSMKTKNLIPIYNSLRAKNRVNYSGKSLDFRLKNPRNFEYKYKPNVDVILVDDIITTGTTLMEAKKALEQYNVNVLFGLTLADAKL